MVSYKIKQITALLIFLLTQSMVAGISVIQEGKNLKVEIDGELFTEFRNDRHVPCLYPLMSPDGTHLTRQYPFVEGVKGEESDHPHHIGLWFAHGDVNGHDFWHGRRGERIVTTRLHHQSAQNNTDDSSARFMAVMDWVVNNQKILTEKRTYTISANGADRIIDVTCQLKATETDLVFGDTKEGAFALRVAPTMRLTGEVAQGGITNSNGIKDNKTWGKRANWVALHGPDATGTPTVAAIFDHPNNLRHPTWWHARGYGLLTANPFGPNAYGDKDFQGETEYTLKRGGSLTLKYRVLLHQGDVPSAKLDERWAAFAEQD